MPRPKVLFIGNYLSGAKGTTSLAFRLSEKLHTEYDFSLVSSKKNKLLRVLDIIWHCITGSQKQMVVDVYSGQAFYMTRIAIFVSRLFSTRKIKLVLRGGNLPRYVEVHTTMVMNTLKRADAIYTPSRFLKEYFEAKGLSINLLENFVDLSRFQFKRTNKDNYQLLWVRSFAAIYNPEIPIQVVAILRKQHIPVRLTMIGPDDGRLASCKALASSLGVEQYITFTGAIPNHRLPEYYQSHSIYLNTTSYESFGNSLMEAASCGIPFVSSAVGEIPYLWQHNETCLLVRELMAEAYAEAVKKYLNDPLFYNEISMRAKINADHYSWETVQPKWLAVLNES